MPGGFRTVAEKAVERRPGRLRPFARYQSSAPRSRGLHWSSHRPSPCREFAVRIKEQRIAAVRHRRNERDIFVDIGDRIRVALESGRAIAVSALGLSAAIMRWLGTASALPMKMFHRAFTLVSLGCVSAPKITRPSGIIDGTPTSVTRRPGRRHSDVGDQYRHAIAVTGIDCLRIVHPQVGAVSVQGQRDCVRSSVESGTEPQPQMPRP